jgi:hypothetical protein
MTTQSCSTT